MNVNGKNKYWASQRLGRRILENAANRVADAWVVQQRLAYKAGKPGWKLSTSSCEIGSRLLGVPFEHLKLEHWYKIRAAAVGYVNGWVRDGEGWDWLSEMFNPNSPR